MQAVLNVSLRILQPYVYGKTRSTNLAFTEL